MQPFVMQPFAGEPTLVGGLVRLRPFTGADAPAMAAILADAEVRRLTGSRGDQAEGDRSFPLDDLAEWYGSRADQPDRLDLAVVDLGTGRVVGEVVLNAWDAGRRSVNFRALVGPAGRNRGLGTEAARLVLDHAFRVVGVRRVTLEVYDFNPRARHVYRGLGFVHEATRRNALRVDGRWVDAHAMVLHARDWEELATSR